MTEGSSIIEPVSVRVAPWRTMAAAAVLLAILVSDVVAQTLSSQTVVDLQTLSGAVISPDGLHVAYQLERPPIESAPRAVNESELWIVPSAGGTARHIVNAGHSPRRPQWSPDGNMLAWLSSTSARAPAQVYLRPAKGGEPRVLTDSRGGVEALSWSPDGSRIAYTAYDAPSEQQQRAHAEGRDWIVFDVPISYLRLYVMDVATGHSVLVTRAPMSVHFFDWSPAGDRLVLGASPTGSADDRELRVRPYVVDAAGGEPRLLVEHFGRLTYPRWSLDGRWIAWLAGASVRDPAPTSVFVVAAAGDAQPRNLTPDYAGTPTWLGALPGTRDQFVFLSEEGQATTLRHIDPHRGDVQPLAQPAQILTGAPSFDRSGRLFASTASSPTHPGEVFVGTVGRRAELRRLTRSNPQLESLTLGAQEVVRWKSRDGTQIEGMLVKPVGFREGVRYPVIVHVHGGSENVITNGWRGSYVDWGQSLAARGYAVIYPNYRGSRGRGAAFMSGNRRDLMGREWEDIESALDHVIAMGIGDAQRAGIYGFSWGGYAAGWGATYASHRFKAAVGGAGIYNWISEAGSNDTRMHEQIAHWDAPLYEHFLLYLERSPIYEVRKAQTPMLLLHGELDQACPIGQAIEMHTALKWKGVPVELVIYPREGHGMRERLHQADFLSRGLAWFDRHLKAMPTS